MNKKIQNTVDYLNKIRKSQNILSFANVAVFSLSHSFG